jgi:hypothetical protein
VGSCWLRAGSQSCPHLLKLQPMDGFDAVSSWKIERQLRQSRQGSLLNHLRSIHEDAEFVDDVRLRHFADLPLICNLRSGKWYCRAWDGECRCLLTAVPSASSAALRRLLQTLRTSSPRTGTTVTGDSRRRAST